MALEIMHTKLLKFKRKGHCSGNHGNHNNWQHIFLSQESSHNNIVKLQSDNIRDKKIIFSIVDPLKYEQRSPRPRSSSQRFLCAVCIYSLALLLIYSDLTQLSELTQHKYRKSLRSRISCERVISIFVTQRQRMLRK